MHTKLIAHIRKYTLLNDEDIPLVCDRFVPSLLKNKDLLLEDGQVCRSLYFVTEGCLRMYHDTEKGVEQTTQLAIENWWMSDYFSFLDNTPSENNIHAVGKTAVLSIGRADYEELLLSVPSLERYFRIMAQRALAASHHRLRLIHNLSKEEIYLHFKSSFPAFLQRIPQYMLASYLGLTPEYLSELRKKHS